MPDGPHIGTPTGAVFLSYASQDAEAARRICEALRGAGIETWFDRSEIRGGDAWDQSIRRQIKGCALFMPVISANTQERAEGYFRLEWHLAEQRSLLMAKGTPFVIPVSIDATSDSEAIVPDAFLAVQWTKLPDGETPAAFAERVRRLLSVSHAAQDYQKPIADGPTSVSRQAKASRLWLIPAVGGVVALAALAIWQPWRKGGKGAPIEPNGVSPQLTSPQSEARQIVQRAGAVWDNGDEPSRDKMVAADELYARALTLDPTDAEVWAAAARLDAFMMYYNFDRSEERRQEAQRDAARAVSLAPNLFAARRAQACVFGFVVHTPEMLLEAEKIYRSLVLERPDLRSLESEFGIVLRDEGHFDEAGAIFEKAGLIKEIGWNNFVAAKYAEANKISDLLLARGHSKSALLLKAHVEYLGLEDIKA
ncbi:MAG TPA: TIR domain-containing protein, partial [Opitutaceae bacterium]|nr:TIR domain-containing protein [Opitutaceae bacterium]